MPQVITRVDSPLHAHMLTQSLAPLSDKQRRNGNPAPHGTITSQVAKTLNLRPSRYHDSTVDLRPLKSAVGIPSVRGNETDFYRARAMLTQGEFTIGTEVPASRSDKASSFFRQDDEGRAVVLDMVRMMHALSFDGLDFPDNMELEVSIQEKPHWLNRTREQRS